MYACNLVFNNSSNRPSSSCIVVQIFGCGEYCMCKYGVVIFIRYRDNKVYGANMGLIWGRQDPGGPRVGPINFAIWVTLFLYLIPQFLSKGGIKTKLTLQQAHKLFVTTLNAILLFLTRHNDHARNDKQDDICILTSYRIGYMCSVAYILTPYNDIVLGHHWFR